MFAKRNCVDVKRSVCVWSENYGSWLRGERGALVTEPFHGKFSRALHSVNPDTTSDDSWHASRIESIFHRRAQQEEFESTSLTVVAIVV